MMTVANMRLRVCVMQAKAVVTREAEFAGPAWMFGSRSYQVLPDGRSAPPKYI